MKIKLTLSLMFTALCCVVANADDIALPAVERVELDNGVVLILNEKHDVPLIGLEAVIRGGAVADPADKHGLGSLLAGLLEKGAGSRDAGSFAETIAAVGGELGASAGVESITISADFMARDAALMTELVADMLQRPTLAGAEFEKLRSRSIDLIKSAKGSDPNVLMTPYANAFLFADHPYGNPVGGSEASLAAITYADVRDHYANLFGGDRLIISVSGDFDTAEMRDMLAAAFGEWPAAQAALPEIPVIDGKQTARVLLVDKPGATQTYFFIGNTGVPRNYSKRADLNLANTVFGGRFSSMLNTALRVESGLTYGARSSVARYSAGGSVFLRSYTQTDTTVEAIDMALDILDRLRESGLEETMVASGRNYIMGQFPPELETASQLAALFATLELYGNDASYINDYGTQLGATTSESVANVIREVYPDRDNLVFTILGDAEVIREQIAKYGEVTETTISAESFHP